jgi:hypothetical protein
MGYGLPVTGYYRVRQMDRKSQTALLIGECDHCLRSPHHNTCMLCRGPHWVCSRLGVMGFDFIECVCY